MKKFKTIHASRTLMFSELSRVMDHVDDNSDFLTALTQNVTGKKSNLSIVLTTKYLLKLYGFNLDDSVFKAFSYFWKISEPNEKPVIAFIFAVCGKNAPKNQSTPE